MPPYYRHHSTHSLQLSPERVWVINNRRKIVGSVNNCEIFGELIDARIVRCLCADKQIWIVHLRQIMQNLREIARIQFRCSPCTFDSLVNRISSSSLTISLLFTFPFLTPSRSISQMRNAVLFLLNSFSILLRSRGKNNLFS